jgi:CheY-like chemotaxis protein
MRREFARKSFICLRLHIAHCGGRLFLRVCKCMQRRILVVEDNASNKRLLEMLLHRAGYAVEVASHGDQALQKLRDTAFDLVITDNNMPGMTGEELAAKVQENRPGTPLMLVTGDLLDEPPAASSGIRAVLRKPIIASEFFAAVQTVLGEEQGPSR